MGKLIYRFTNQGAKKVLNSKEILGGKGANLAQMAKLGLPVPPGFTISNKVCEYFEKTQIGDNAKCLLCKKVLSCPASSTTGPLRHLAGKYIAYFWLKKIFGTVM